MDRKSFLEHLRLPPERVRLAEIYPQLPHPIPFATAFPEGPAHDDDEALSAYRGLYSVSFELKPKSWWYGFTVPKEHYRIVEEYQAARDRQEMAEEACAAARWQKGAGAPRPVPVLEPKPYGADEDRAKEDAASEDAVNADAADPELAAIPREGRLTPRQEDFCKHYAVQPVATRAAILAGYAEQSADSYGPKLLKNPLVLERIAALRAAKNVRYTIERDTLHDKLEAVFFEALGGRSFSAAVAALRMQAQLGGLALRPAAGEKPERKVRGNRTGGAKKPGAAAPRRRRSGKTGLRRG